MPNPNITQKKLKWIKDGKFKALGVNFSIHLEEMEDLNYNMVMEAASNLVHHWSRRNLTVLGRITVVKSLLIPKFNHFNLSIPNPTKAFLKRLHKLIYEFVWKNKKDKISRDQLSNDYADGGLRLFKVDLFFEALKGTWIRRIAAGNVDEKGILLFSKITGLTTRDLEKGPNFTLNVAKNINNMFWKEVLVVWRKVQRKHTPNTVEDVLKSCMWENDVFKTTKKDINLKTWCKAGIYYVTDLVHLEEGRFMTLKELKDMYGLRSFFLIL